ncbi:MAG: sulfatase [Planctomycetota bacterium]
MRLQSPGILLASLAALIGGACGHEEPRPRGVLLISIDSLRADHLSSNGYKSPTAPQIPTSPSIDARLAAKGLVFERAVSTTCWTLPAHMALMTGQPDELHGVKSIHNALDISHTTLASSMRKAGWRTAGFWSGINLHPTFGFDRGFERYVDCSGVEVPDEGVFQRTDPGATEAITELQQLSHQGVTSPKLVSEFDTWFDSLGRGEQFFAFVHFWDVHFDYAAPPEDDVFDPDYRGALNGSNFFSILDKQDPRDPADFNRLLSLYDAEIRLTDRHVGMLLDRLERAGRLDDTLVILVSDHGEEFYEHGRFGHYHSLYEEVVRIPMVIRWPAGFAPARTQELASLADVAPTILDLCNVRRPETMWGRSLAQVGKQALPPRLAPMEVTFAKPQNFMRGVHAGDHKVVAHSRDEQATYFDLQADPAEKQPLLEKDLSPELGLRIAAAKAAWEALAKQALGLAGSAQSQLPAHVKQRLDQSGYAGK